MPTGINVIVIKDGKILLIKRQDLSIWALPGGIIERGETPEQAATRETREETGIKVKVGELRGIFVRTIPFLEDVLLVYQGQYLTGKTKTSFESPEVGWFDQKIIEKICPFFVQQIVRSCQEKKTKLKVEKLNCYESRLIWRFFWYRLKQRLSKFIDR